jgi:hypothetical protein
MVSKARAPITRSRHFRAPFSQRSLNEDYKPVSADARWERRRKATERINA